MDESAMGPITTDDEFSETTWNTRDVNQGGRVMFDIDKERDAINASYKRSLMLLDVAVDINNVADVDSVGFSTIFLKPVRTHSEFEQLLKKCRLEIAGLHLNRYYLHDGHVVVIYQAVYQDESIDIGFSISEEVNKTLEIISWEGNF